MTNTTLYYFSGTGNSLSIARKLSRQLDDAPVRSIAQVAPDEMISHDSIGIVTPIYMYTMPHRVISFIRQIASASYIYVVYTGAGGLGNGVKTTKQHFTDQGLVLNALFNIAMPSNYTPYGCPSEAKQKELITEADARLPEVASIINERRTHFESGNTSAWNTYVFPGLLYKLGHPHIAAMDKGFTLGESCNGCGLCARVCPVDNIALSNNQPAWQHHCEQCYACLQWCPEQAIQYRGKTKDVARYHHPEIAAKDIIEGRTNS